MQQKPGRIIAAVITKDVTFEPDGPVNDLIDDAYRTKYHGNAYLAPMIRRPARSATVKSRHTGPRRAFRQNRHSVDTAAPGR